MKANDAMFLVWKKHREPVGRLEIVSRAGYLARGVSSDCTHTMGAVFGKWAQIPEAQVMECVLWTGFELVEHYGVPIAEVAKELEKIEGFTEYWNRIGKRSCALF